MPYTCLGPRGHARGHDPQTLRRLTLPALPEPAGNGRGDNRPFKSAILDLKNPFGGVKSVSECLGSARVRQHGQLISEDFSCNL